MNTPVSQYAIILVWLIYAIMLNTSICSYSIPCNQKDKQALLNFKKGVIDPSRVLSSWSIEKDCCEWRGVKCDNITRRVTELSLPCSTTPPTYSNKVNKSHCLTGSIYLSLLEFEFLHVLNLHDNDFLTIQFDPVDSSNFHNLSALTLPRPSVNSSVLRYLDLSHNTNLATNNLQWLSRVSSLEYLDLSGIDLHRVTNWLELVTKLPSLAELNLNSCQLENLSPSLQYANFTALESLRLTYNNFDSELPKWLFNLTSGISDIELYSNHLRGQLPEALLNLRHLESLELDFNNLDGSIPDWLGQLEHLKSLGLHENMFSGCIPTNLGNLSSLIYLSLGDNNFTGIVSKRNFAKLSKLKSLNIYSSPSTPPLIFDFEPDWIPPFQLEELVVGFAGPKLPVWFYTQRYIQSLYILYSSFEAGNEFWNFASRTTELYLQGNSIDGEFSNVLLNSTFIILISNDLKGGLPRLTSNVVVAAIAHNSLSGTISPLLCDHKMLNEKSNLKFLDLSFNYLSGELTNCWKYWRSLVHVNMGNNNLTGQIPSSMGLLSNLVSLHLHENKLCGEIPPSLQNCHSLLIFNVRDNNFSGSIPNWIPQSAMALQLRSNQFNGNIPPQICQMSSLIILDIANNKISGHIPYCLNNIKALSFNNVSQSKLSFYFPSDNIYYVFSDALDLVTKGQGLEYRRNLHFMTLVDLSSNDLSGTIPPQIFSLVGLHSLNLSFNKLTGEIPKEIGNIKNLESLDLSKNRFSGEIPESMSSLSFLSYLNLSFNNFTDKIPSGTQLQSFSPLSYIGNPYLCGLPLAKICSQNGKDKDTNQKDKNMDQSEFLSWFYIGIESGFVISFLGVCGAIFFNRKWRHAYFKLLYDMRDRLYVMIVIKMNSFR